MSMMAMSGFFMLMTVIMASFLEVRQGVEENITKQAAHRECQQNIGEVLALGVSLNETNVHAINQEDWDNRDEERRNN